MADLLRIQATAPTEEIVNSIHEDGGVIVEGMFPVDTIATMREGILKAASMFQAGGASQGVEMDTTEFVGANTIRFSSLGKISSAFFGRPCRRRQSNVRSLEESHAPGVRGGLANSGGILSPRLYR